MKHLHSRHIEYLHIEEDGDREFVHNTINKINQSIANGQLVIRENGQHHEIILPENSLSLRLKHETRLKGDMALVFEIVWYPQHTQGKMPGNTIEIV